MIFETKISQKLQGQSLLFLASLEQANKALQMNKKDLEISVRK